MPIRGLLFDKDGTLLDFYATWTPANERAALAAARGNSELAARLLARGGWDAGAKRLRSGSPLAAGTSDDIALVFSELLPGVDQKWLAGVVAKEFVSAGLDAQIVPGTAGMLTKLQGRGLALGIATNDSEGGIHRSFGKHPDILAHFKFLAGSDSGHGAKPGPGMLNAFCRAEGLLPHEVAVIGDSTHDLEMGRAGGAGMNIGVLTGTSTEAELAVLADQVLASIVELPGQDWLAPAKSHKKRRGPDEVRAVIASKETG